MLLNSLTSREDFTKAYDGLTYFGLRWWLANLLHNPGKYSYEQQRIEAITNLIRCKKPSKLYYRRTTQDYLKPSAEGLKSGQKKIIFRLRGTSRRRPSLSCNPHPPELCSPPIMGIRVYSKFRLLCFPCSIHIGMRGNILFQIVTSQGLK